jgi:hypothetical protein
MGNLPKVCGQYSSYKCRSSASSSDQQRREQTRLCMVCNAKMAMLAMLPRLALQSKCNESLLAPARLQLLQS